MDQPQLESSSISAGIEKETSEHYQSFLQKRAVRHDRLFAILFGFQYMLALVLAFCISPLTWAGQQSATHVHIYAALFLGAMLSLPPILMVLQQPGRKINQWMIMLCQMLYSILFIHLTGGRIETHFHIFGSLAFLAFYNDIRLVVVATAITGMDHFFRGMLWPESVYGVLSADPWRAVEHSAWVVFEDIVLFFSIHHAKLELLAFSRTKAQLNSNLNHIEYLVARRTQELTSANETILSQQESLVASAKLSVLGEMSSGIAHEINNPLTAVIGNTSMMIKALDRQPLDIEKMRVMLARIDVTARRISKIIKGLRTVSRESSHDEMEETQVASIVNDAIELCSEKLRKNETPLQVDCPANLSVRCRPAEILQILLNLIGNASDAIEEQTEKWIRLEVRAESNRIVLQVTDSGRGIPTDIVEKMMNPFFTTKAVGKGTGLGLSISHKIAAEHHGDLRYDSETGHTRFTLSLPVPNVTQADPSQAA